MDKELKQQFLQYLSKIKIGQDIRWQMIIFASDYPFKDKKAKFFLTLKTDNEKIGFIYKYIVAAAYQYGVPQIYIKKTIKTKESYLFWKSLKHSDSSDAEHLQKSKFEMFRSYYDLLIAVNQMIKEKNSRKGKLEQIIYKISENKKPE